MTEFEFAEKVNQYKNMVFRLAVSYLRNIHDAEDITQEVFMKFYTKNISFQNPEEERAWLIRVTINASKDLLKSFWFKRTEAMDENIPFRDKEQSDLFYAVMMLDAKYRTVIHLYYYEDYSIKEIAKILRMKETTVQTRLQRARKKLEDILRKEYGNAYTIKSKAAEQFFG